MTDRRRAHVRLSILAALGLLLAVFACRPAWSPDGKRLLFPTVSGLARLGVGLYEREAGATRLLLAPREDLKFAAMTWTPDGETAVVVTSEGEKSLTVHLHPMAAAGEVRTLPVPVDANVYEAFLTPPTVVGGRLFLTVEGLLRVDLASGAIERRPAEEGHSLILAPRADGVAYVSMGRGEHEAEWEVGVLDPQSLARTPLFTAPDAKWEVAGPPAFTRDLRRTALPVRTAAEGDLAILVFAGAELEATLPLGSKQEFGFQSVDWAADGVTLLVGFCRRKPDGPGLPYEWGLHETTISGSVTRHTVVLRTQPTDQQARDDDTPALLFQAALSPDGRLAAFSTAMIDGVGEEIRGLYLVDLADKEREVTRVPFPAEER